MSTRPVSRAVAKRTSRPVSGGKAPGPPPAVIDDLFKNGEPGLWLDPTDMATMFQNAAGTVPVTAAGQPVMLIRDKSGNGNHVELKNATYALDVYGKPYIESVIGTAGRTVKSLDLSGVTQMTFWAGLTNYVKEPAGFFFEHSPSASGTPGAFSLMIPGTDKYQRHTTLWYRGDTTYTDLNIEGDEPPYTAYYTGMINSVAPQMRMRKNGHDKGVNNNVPGGRFRDEVLYVLARNYSGNSFEGRLYQLVMRGGNTTDAEMLAAEGFVAGKMGQVGPLPTFSADFVNQLYRFGPVGSPPSFKTFEEVFTVVRNSSAMVYKPNGFIETVGPNVARIEHDPVTRKAIGIRIEEPRTNLLVRSTDFTDAKWSLTQSGPGLLPVVTPNAGQTPAGSGTAGRIVLNAPDNDSQSSIFQTASVVMGSTYAGSVFLRADRQADVGKQILVRHAGNTAYQIVTLTLDWRRVERLEVANGGAAQFVMCLRPALGGSSGEVRMLAWQAQLELGPSVSTPILTAASQATRAGDDVRNLDVSGWYNQTEGTLYCDFTPGVQNIGGTTAGAWLSETINPARSLVAVRRQNTTVYGVITASDASLQATLSAGPGLPIGQTTRVALGFKADGTAFARDGLYSAKGAAITMPAPERLVVGGAGNGQQYTNGLVRQIVYYPVKLPDEYLMGITK